MDMALVGDIIVVVLTVILILGLLFIYLIWNVVDIRQKELRNEYLKTLNDEERLIIARYQDVQVKFKDLFKRKKK